LTANPFSRHQTAPLPVIAVGKRPVNHLQTQQQYVENIYKRERSPVQTLLYFERSQNIVQIAYPQH